MEKFQISNFGTTPYPREWADIAEDQEEVVTRLKNDQTESENFILAESRLGSEQNV